MRRAVDGARRRRGHRSRPRPRHHEGEDDAAPLRWLHGGADHVELAARPRRADAGRAHDRSGTSRRRRGCPVSRSSSPSTTPAHGRRRSTRLPNRVRAVHGRARRGAAELRRRHRRERAEPEPVLAPAVRARRLERLGAGLPPAARAGRTTRSRPSTPRCGSGAARSRRAAPTGPKGTRHTSSPTAFIQALGPPTARADATTPVMDGLAFHPYPDNSSQSPDFPHPRSTTIGLADYDKLVTLLGAGVRRHGAARLCAADPLRRVRDRVGRCPTASARSTPAPSPTTTRPVDEYQQAAAYDLGLRLAFCQPNVVGMLLFHSHDEEALLELAVGRLLR